MALEPVNVQINIGANTAGAVEAEGSLNEFGASLSGVAEIAGGALLAVGAYRVVNFLKDTAVGTVEAAAGFDKLMNTIQGNTAMSDADLETMRQTVLNFSKQSGLSTDDLAQGFMHITNEGFNAAGAVKMLETSMKAAIDTGGSVSDISNSLAVIMHNFGANSNESADYMNKLMQIAAHGNLTLQDLAQNFQLVSSIASNAHVPIEQLGGLFDVLTKSTGNAATAQFEEERILTSIISPTKAQSTAIAELSKNHKELEADFSASGLRAKGLTTVLEEVYQATGGNSEALKKLFPDQRAFIGVTALMKDNLSEYKDMVKQAGDATKNDLLSTENQKRQKDMDVEWGKLTAGVKAFGIEIGNDAKPQLERYMGLTNDSVLPALENMYNWFKQNQEALLVFGFITDDVGKKQQQMGQEIEFVVVGAVKDLEVALQDLGNEAITVVNAIIKGFDAIPSWIRSLLGGSSAGQNFSAIPLLSQSNPITASGPSSYNQLIQNLIPSKSGGNTTNQTTNITNNNNITNGADVTNLSKLMGLQVTLTR